MRTSLVCPLVYMSLTIALDRDGQISRFSYGEFAIVEATDSQSTSYCPDLAESSEAKHGESTPDPASTVSGDCRPGTHTTRSSRPSELQPASLDHLYRYHRFYRQCKRDDEGIGGLEFCVEQGCPLEDKGSDRRRRPLHYYHLCVRPLPLRTEDCL